MRVVHVRLFAARHRGWLGFASGVMACALVGGGVAIAAIPSTTTGALTACVSNSSGAVRLIDYQAGRRCAANEYTVTWSKGYRYRGGWSSTVAYGVLDVVTYGGSSYLATHPSTNKAPTTNPAYWGVLAARGAPGPQGAPGTAGSALGWATVGPDGTIYSHGGQLAAPTVTNPAAGVYCLTGTEWVSQGGPYAVTLLTASAGGHVTVNPYFWGSSCNSAGYNITVSTFDSAGTATNEYFTIAKLG